MYWRAAYYVLWLAFGFAGMRSAAQTSGSLKVEQVAENSITQTAGLKRGDILQSWSRGGAAGPLSTPFDVALVEIEEEPIGPVELKGVRNDGNSKLSWTLGPASWGLTVMPALDPAIEQQYREGARHLQEGNSVAAMDDWKRAAQSAGEQKCWILGQAADATSKQQLSNESDELYTEAVACARSNPAYAALLLRDWATALRGRKPADGAQRAKFVEEAQKHLQSAVDLLSGSEEHKLLTASMLYELGRLFAIRQDYKSAAKYFRQALEIQQVVAPDSLPMAASLANVANTSLDLGNSEEAELTHIKALAIVRKLAPGSMELARMLNNGGRIAQERYEPDTAQQYYVESLAITEKLAPGGLIWSSTLNNLTNMARGRGELARAEEYAQRALAARKKEDPNSLDTAQTLNNLSSIQQLRGDYVAAEQSLQRALHIQESEIPGSKSMAMTLTNLAILEQIRGEWDLSESYLLRALKIHQSTAPDSEHSISTLVSLGVLYYRTGQLSKSETYSKQAMAVVSSHNLPEEAEVGAINNLGAVYEKRKQLSLAEQRYRHAFDILQRSAPGSLDQAEVLQNLGDVAYARNKLADAEKQWEDALEIRQKLAPGTEVLADTLLSLGKLARQRQQNERAATYYSQAIDAVEAQDTRLGGTQESHAGLLAGYADLYHDYAALLLSEHRPALAFEIVERSRARALRSMLAERDLVFAGASSDLERDRKRNAAAYDQVLSQIGGLSQTKDPPEKQAAQLARLQLGLRELTAQRALFIDRLRRDSPRLAALQYPRTLDISGVCQALDSGTGLLSYSVGESSTELFVVLAGDDRLHTFHISAGRDRLRRQVDKYRKAIEGSGADSTPADRESRALYELLLAPAESVLQQSNRLLIVPDGPLLTLPFAALRRNDGTYLVFWRPLHFAPSATIYSELKSGRTPDSNAGTIVIFAEAQAPGPALQAELRTISRTGASLTPLPAAEQEAREIQHLYGDRAIAYINSDATEERAKSVDANARYIHFAAHAVLDDRLPLNSGLVLASSASSEGQRDNGFLQAWEFFEQVRWHSDLVVLAACQTGLGEEFAGEGLLGLTRAVQYAGARSVLATLWSIDDRSTAKLMQRFYGYLRAGDSKDEALRKAQLDLVKSPATAAPAFWAAFTLNGDWR
jgi:CHAT domain-containing protein/Tfp pilus assembly protein PilF